MALGPTTTTPTNSLCTPHISFGTPVNRHNGSSNRGPTAWGFEASLSDTSGTPNSNLSHQERSKGYRYRNYYQPANSSPLTRAPSDFADIDDMDDEDDDGRASGFHEPSSPLGRVATFNIGSSKGSARRGDENESPLVRRRKAQYKSMGSFASGGSASARRASIISSSPGNSRRFPSSPPIASLFASAATPNTPEDPQRAFLRERFKRRCFERAAKAREKAVKAKRRGEGVFDVDDDDESSSRSRRRGGKRGSKSGRKSAEDDGDVGMEGDREDSSSEDDEDIINDELFSRIMLNVNRKLQHSYRLSYQHEVGSSFDPDIEDVAGWEEELKVSTSQPIPQGTTSSPSTIVAGPSTNSSTCTTTVGGSDDFEDFDPAEWEEDELEAYAEEYARLVQEGDQPDQVPNKGQGQQDQMAFSSNLSQDSLGVLENIPEDELFGTWNWSESEPEDVEMQM